MPKHRYNLDAEDIQAVLDTFDLPLTIDPEQVLVCWDKYIDMLNQDGFSYSEQDDGLWETLNRQLEDSDQFPTNVIDLFDYILDNELVSDTKPLRDTTLLETLTPSQLTRLSEELENEYPQLRFTFQQYLNQDDHYIELLAVGSSILSAVEAYQKAADQKSFHQQLLLFNRLFYIEKNYAVQTDIVLTENDYIELIDPDLDESQESFIVYAKTVDYPTALLELNDLNNLHKDIQNGVYNPGSKNFGNYSTDEELIQVINPIDFRKLKFN